MVRWAMGLLPSNVFALLLLLLTTRCLKSQILEASKLLEYSNTDCEHQETLKFLEFFIPAHFPEHVQVNVIQTTQFGSNYHDPVNEIGGDRITELLQFQFPRIMIKYFVLQNVYHVNIEKYSISDDHRRFIGWRSLNIVNLMDHSTIPRETFLNNIVRTDVDWNLVVSLKPGRPGVKPNMERISQLINYNSFNYWKYKIQVYTKRQENTSKSEWTLQLQTTQSFDLDLENNETDSACHNEGRYIHIVQSVCFYCKYGNSDIVRIHESSAGLGLESTRKTPANDGLTFDQLFPDFTKAFHGRKLKAVAGRGIPVLNRFEKDNSTGEFVPTGGFQTSVVLALKKGMNFTMEIGLDSFGVLQPYGYFDGIVGKLQYNLADLGFGAAINLERYRAVHFFAPNSFQSMRFVTNRPAARIKWQAIFRSFTFNVWVLLLGTAYFMLLPLFMVIYRMKMNTSTASLGPAFVEGLGFLVRPLLEQPLSKIQMLNDAGVGGATVVTLWLLVTIVLGTAYKSILMRNLISPTFDVVPNTYDELAQDKHFGIYVHYVGGALEKDIARSKTATFQAIGRRVVLENDIVSCIEHAYSSKSACLSYRDNILGESSRHFSDKHGNLLVRIAPEAVFSLPICLLCPKNALYKDSMDFILRQHFDMGLSTKYTFDEIELASDQGKHAAKTKHKDRPVLETKSTVSLSIEHFLSCFALLAGGCSIAFVAFLMEFITHCCKRCISQRYEVNTKSNPAATSIFVQDFQHVQRFTSSSNREWFLTK